MASSLRRAPARQAAERRLQHPRFPGRACRRRRSPGGTDLDAGRAGRRRPVATPRGRRPPSRRDRDRRRSAGTHRPAAARGWRQRDRGGHRPDRGGYRRADPQGSVTRIRLDGAGGTRHVTAGLGLGVALAAAAGAPVRLADAVLDRVARPVAGDDLLTPFLDHVPPAGRLVNLPGQRPRYQPRNLSFADGLDRWDLDRGPRRESDRAYSVPNYSATVDGSGRDPVRSCPAARRIGRPGPDDLRRRLPRRQGHLPR